LQGATESSSSLLAAATRRLSCALRGEERNLRWRIGGSQMHMTANRNGLTDFEEIYLCCLLSGTIRRNRGDEEHLNGDLQRALNQSTDESNRDEPSLKELLAATFTKFAEDLQ
jgi:hypothetical protein